jgi:4-amino-4-deoxy-L-arabinose transferase-like glycosyltransferase
MQEPITSNNTPSNNPLQPGGAGSAGASRPARRWWPYLLLALIILLGLAIRLYGLGERTMTHIEIYVPGIPLPVELSDPAPRLTVKATLFGMLMAEEPHPPGYYLLMLAWTRIFGAGIESLRLPSAIFGILSILLVFILGAQEKNRNAGLLAALLLALNGHQVFWSQLAKNYVLSEFVGLAATVMLLLALRGGKWERWFQLMYLALLLAGVSLTIYFWPILITHMIWVLVEKWENRTLPGIFQWQYLALILGTPLVSLAIFQSRRASYLDPNFIPSMVRFFGFGYAVEVIPKVFANFNWLKLLPPLILVIGGAFLAAGLWNARDRKDARPSRGFPALLFLAAALLTTPLIFCMGKYLSGDIPRAGKNVMLSALLPAILVGFYFFLQFVWSRRDKWKGVFQTDAPNRWNFKVSAYLALLPVLSVAVISPVVALFNSRGILLYTPYLLLTIAAGALALIKRSRLWIPVLITALLILCAGNIFFRNSTLEHPTDYKSLAEKWIPEIQPDDLVLVRLHWSTTPIFYYLDTNQLEVISTNRYLKHQTNYDNSRIWVLSLVDLEGGPDMKTILQDYRLKDTITGRNIQADLYEK